MKKLHSEWFPIDYPQSFFDRMSEKNTITIGCFYKIVLSDGDSDHEEFKSGTGSEENSASVMIGCIFSRVDQENERNSSILTHIDASRWNS